MWIFSRNGFVDLVQDPRSEHSHELLIRTQVEADMNAFVRLLDEAGGTTHTVETTFDGDYRFVTTAAKDTVAKAVALLVCGIDYPRFQNSLHFHLGQNNSYVVWLNSNDLKVGQLLRQP